MRVLLATDGSPSARLAESVFLRLRGFVGCPVTVATVVQPAELGLAAPPALGMPNIASPQLVEANVRMFDMIRETREEAARHAAERLEAQGFDTETITLEGDPADVLLSLAEEREVELLVVGSRGESGLAAFLLGSVARKLISSSRCSVLVGRPYAGLDAEESRRKLEAAVGLNALVAVDGSAGGEAAVQALKSAGRDGFAHVEAFTAEPLGVLPAGVDPLAFAEVFQYDKDLAERTAAAASEALVGTGTQVDWSTQMGRPGEAIARRAAEIDADLVVLGAHRHGAVERFLLGSVSYEVATTAPCSVWAVRVRQGT